VTSNDRTADAGPRGGVVLKPRHARPFFARHPWVYTHSVARVERTPSAGDEVELFSHEGVFIARGLFNPASTLCVRLYRWDAGPLDSAFWRERLEAAVRLRRDVLRLDEQSSAYRLVFSEGDGLSGLVVDRYDRWLVAQFSSLALLRRREFLLDQLLELTGAEGIIARPDRAVAAEEGLDRQDVRIVGSVPDAPVAVVENGLAYEVELGAGQKTGFYCDQRDNRLAVARYCRGKRVLDLFCFTGAFSLSALRHGEAESTLGVDSSAPAIEAARRNAAANGLAGAAFEAGDVLKTLDRLKARGERFEVVVCDPPKFAAHARDVEAALKGYRRLNLAAVSVLEPGGILASCSCSGLVDPRAFLEMLGQVAEDSRRSIQVLERRGQAPDHPVSASCLESDYLMCLIGRVA
jgi:23S rRNA (cytosine1962-C5)-methyltransferase